MQGAWDHYNISLSFAVIRLFRYLGQVPGHGPLPGWASSFLFLVNIVGDVLVFLWGRRLRTNQLCIALPLAVVLLSPLCWEVYMVIGHILVALSLRVFHDLDRSENSLME